MAAIQSGVAGASRLAALLLRRRLRLLSRRARLHRERQLAGFFLACRTEQIVPAGNGSGTGSVTSVAAGAWPSWLTPSVTNATTTPSLAVVASAIPNAALANSMTTINGQACTLGASCSVRSLHASDGNVGATQCRPRPHRAGSGAVASGAGTNVLGAAAMLPASTRVNGTSCALGAACSV